MSRMLCLVYKLLKKPTTLPKLIFLLKKKLTRNNYEMHRCSLGHITYYEETLHRRIPVENIMLPK